MAQVQTQIQQQRQEQQLRLSLQQLQLVRLLEMPLAEYEQAVNKEMLDNPALEDYRYSEHDIDSGADGSLDADNENDSGDDPYSERLDEKISEQIERYSDDDLPVYTANNGTDERDERPLGDTVSFIEELEAQMMDHDLDDTQRQVLRYLIGLLDNRGYIDTPPSTIVEELAFTHYIYIDEDYVNEMLRVLKSFDPPGIGAKDTQECLLLQIDRELNEDAPVSQAKEQFIMLQRRVVADHYSLFINRDEQGLQKALGVSAAAVKALFAALKKLNVNPGMALSESASSRSETQIPDFIVNTDPDGNIELRLNSGDVPRLHVRQDYIDQLKLYQAKPESLSRSEREALLYTQQKVEVAQMLIESMKQRRRTLYETMKAIITLQRKFILSRDDDDKVRMVLKDVARVAGYDISTVSRVCNSKCCLLDGRIYPLRTFFMLTRHNSEGKEVDRRKIAARLKALIDAEDKANPLSDEQLARMLTKEGMKLARRTVAKYRTELGIPPFAERMR